MSKNTVLRFSEPTETMTLLDGLAFIRRTRRQLDRFDRLRGESGQRIDPEEEMIIRRICNEVESHISDSLQTS